MLKRLTAHKPTFLWIGITSMFLLSCGDEPSKANPKEGTESVEESEPLERFEQAQPGETIVFEEAEYRGTLRVPAGVNVEGIEGSEIVIRPAEGEPGIVLTGEGISNVAHMRVENATGVGILIEERTVRLTNVEVTGTVAGTTYSGHGIRVSESPSFHATSVSSSSNAGSGLRVESTETVSIVHPNYLVPGADFEESASRVIVHPNYLPTVEDKGIVHPNYEPEDGDEVAIVHPNYLPEDEFIIIVHPNYLSGSNFSENAGGGISIVHPNYNPSDITNLNSVFIEGMQANINGGSGINLQGVTEAVISGTVIQGTTGQASEKGAGTGLLLQDSSVSMNSTYIGGNEGAGIKAANSSFALGSASTSLHGLRDNPQDSLSIVHPNYYPTNSVENNNGGGIFLYGALSSNAGKADGHIGAGMSIHSALIQNNVGYGLEVECLQLQLYNTLIQGTQIANPNTTSVKGTGLTVDRAENCPEGAESEVYVDSESIIQGNAASGLRVRHGASVVYEGVLAKNLRGGAIARGKSTQLKLRKADCDSENETEKPCWPPLVSENGFVGLGFSQGASGVIQETIIEKTTHGEINNGPQTVADISLTFGDGIIAIDPEALSIFDSSFVDNARSGAIIWTPDTSLNTAPEITVSDSTFSGGSYAFVHLTQEAFTPNTYSEYLTLPSHDYWSSMVATCTTSDIEHKWTSFGCLAIPDINCNVISNNCEILKPCGDCSMNCVLGDSCDAAQCACPDNAGCCTHTECSLMDENPVDCYDWYCSEELECLKSIEKNPDCIERSKMPCNTSDDCEPTGPSSCTTMECIEWNCEVVVIPNTCAIDSPEGQTECYEAGESNPLNSCERCAPEESTSDWFFTPNFLCDDENPCTTTDTCLEIGENQVCEGIDKVCEGENECMTYACDEDSGECVVSDIIVEEKLCDDGDVCTEDDFCEDGECQQGLTVTDCSDGNACTHDLCTPGGGCVNEPKEAEVCEDDGEPCTPGSCSNGVCVEKDSCDDENPCTTDICDDLVGCQYVSIVGEFCDDNDPCTSDDTCTVENICFGSPKDCDQDESLCTNDDCNSNTGVCSGNQIVCEDGDTCTIEECEEGSGCFIKSSNECNDGSECTDDTCEYPDLGAGYTVQCVFTPNNSNCDDSDVCTSDECSYLPSLEMHACTNTPPNCNDGVPCTTDSCGPETGGVCANTPSGQFNDVCTMTECTYEQFTNDAVILQSTSGNTSSTTCYKNWCDWKDDFVDAGYHDLCPPPASPSTCQDLVTASSDPDVSSDFCQYCVPYDNAVIFCGINDD